MSWRRRVPHVDAKLNSRQVSFAAAITIHAGIFALLLMPGGAERAKIIERPMTLFDMPGPPGPEALPKPPQPTHVAVTPPEAIVVPPPIVPLPVPSPLVVSLLETNAAQSAAGACDLTLPVQEALRTSPAVIEVLHTMPRPGRSVANAIMIWDADWVPFADAPDNTARDIVRDTIAGVVATASEECRMQAQSGPRLLVLPDMVDTIILALGSGTWTWQQLLDTARPQGWVMETPAPAVPQAIAQISPSPASIARR